MLTTRPRLRLTLSLALVALALSACSTMSKNECLTIDWRTIGYEDGVAGYSGDRIGEHRKACAKYGVRTDLSAYQAGREEGLREFCKPDNAFLFGTRGGSYGGVCPADMDDAFRDAYDIGHQLYVLQARLSDADNELGNKRRELNHVEDAMVTASTVIVSTDSTSEQRAAALVDTKQLAERAGRLKNEIRQLERDRARYERDLQDYRAANLPNS
jgi:hypothetical protein